RHVVRCEEYSPSRRSNAPTAPGVLQASASRTIFRLYSTVNRRRVAFATTSIAGPPRACSNALIALRSCLALDSKLPGGHCLTHVGREGLARENTGAPPLGARFTVKHSALRDRRSATLLVEGVEGRASRVTLASLTEVTGARCSSRDARYRPARR